jgi:hypothetical protein
MELLLKNVNEEHLTLLNELAKSLHFELTEAVEDDAHYLNLMSEAKNDNILSEKEGLDFINDLKLAK